MNFGTFIEVFLYGMNDDFFLRKIREKYNGLIIFNGAGLSYCYPLGCFYPLENLDYLS